MSELKKWRVITPYGSTIEVYPDWEDQEAGALFKAWPSTRLSSGQSIVDAMRAAGYRAEPIKEPKMVTVRAEDVEAAIGERGFRTMDEFRCAMARLRAALESAK